jgi:hypothetical protein
LFLFYFFFFCFVDFAEKPNHLCRPPLADTTTTDTTPLLIPAFLHFKTTSSPHKCHHKRLSTVPINHHHAKPAISQPNTKAAVPNCPETKTNIKLTHSQEPKAFNP